MTIQDVVQILTAIGVILTAVVGILNRVSIRKVHRTVNATATAQTARVEQLGRSLQSAGVDVPARPEDVPAPLTRSLQAAGVDVPARPEDVPAPLTQPKDQGAG